MGTGAITFTMEALVEMKIVHEDKTLLFYFSLSSHLSVSFNLVECFFLMYTPPSFFLLFLGLGYSAVMTTPFCSAKF